MNLSPRVNSEICQSCGECCKSFMLFYPGGLARERYDEILRILYLDGVSGSIKEGPGGNWLILHHPCRYLQEQQGRYSCELYNDPCRPQICATFPYPDTTSFHCPKLAEDGRAEKGED